MTQSLRIILAGTPAFGLSCFDAISDSSHQVVGVWTQPDRPAGRGRQLQASPVKQWAKEKGYDVYQPESLRDLDAQESISALDADLMIVIAYGLILPQAVLDLPKLGCVNVHASILPRWRGASPIQQAILAGDDESGVTIMQMDAGMDTGPGLAQVTCTIQGDTAETLHDKLAILSVAPLMQTIDALACGNARAVAQPEQGVTYAPKIKKNDAQVEWQNSASTIDCQIRAFYPWPIAYTLLENGERVRLIEGHVITSPDAAATPGEVIQLDKHGMVVACGTDAYCVTKLQFPGGKMMAVADWLAGGKSNLTIGMCFQCGNS